MAQCSSGHHIHHSVCDSGYHAWAPATEMPSYSHLYNHLRQESTSSPSIFQFIGIFNGWPWSLALIHCGVILYLSICTLSPSFICTDSYRSGQNTSLLRTSVFQDKPKPLTLSFVKMWFLPLREFRKYPVALLIFHKIADTEVLWTALLATLCLHFCWSSY